MKDFVRNALRDGVFGVQDGLVSTVGVLTGVAAGTGDGRIVAITGLVVIAVESLSMAAGSYLSSKSNREYLERLLKEEEELIRRDPEGERREIWDMYKSRGYADREIRMIEKRLFSDPKLLLEDMAHKELGILPDNLENPAGNAVVMGVAYVAGGLVPVLPYLAFPVGAALPLSLLGTSGALLVFGALKGRVVRKAWWKSALEMLAVAGLAGLAGYIIGRAADVLIR